MPNSAMVEDTGRLKTPYRLPSRGQGSERPLLNQNNHANNVRTPYRLPSRGRDSDRHVSSQNNHVNNVKQSTNNTSNRRLVEDAEQRPYNRDLSTRNNRAHNKDNVNNRTLRVGRDQQYLQSASHHEIPRKKTSRAEEEEYARLQRLNKQLKQSFLRQQSNGIWKGRITSQDTDFSSMSRLFSDDVDDYGDSATTSSNECTPRAILPSIDGHGYHARGNMLKVLDRINSRVEHTENHYRLNKQSIENDYRYHNGQTKSELSVEENKPIGLPTPSPAHKQANINGRKRAKTTTTKSSIFYENEKSTKKKESFDVKKNDSPVKISRNPSEGNVKQHSEKQRNYNKGSKKQNNDERNNSHNISRSLYRQRKYDHEDEAESGKEEEYGSYRMHPTVPRWFFGSAQHSRQSGLSEVVGRLASAVNSHASSSVLDGTSSDDDAADDEHLPASEDKRKDHSKKHRESSKSKRKYKNKSSCGVSSQNRF